MMIGKKLKAARKAAKLTQADIAVRLDVSPPQVSRWENDENDMPAARLPDMAAAYETTIAGLFGEIAPPSPAAEIKLPVASLMVAHIAGHLGIDPRSLRDGLVQELARDLQLFSAYAADPEWSDRIDALSALLEGMGAQRRA